ncbi:MAG TPA: PHP domain-containing protein, partial [Spirochaetes bacterium]|nr:PHP domain-containing protein [Spirochaetota bacterium]
MARVDLHVHSKYSKHPSNWFLQRIGASESYTDPQEVFDIARDRGMDFVTITDHNKIEGSLLLKEKYPERAFTGVESTAYFLEEKCKVHILIYGLDERQYGEVQRLRTDIYQLRDFIKENRLAHSVAHGTYSVNGKLSLAVLEKLILLFDVFEGINGARIRMHNNTWIRALMNLTPEIIEDLYGRHRIEPMSTDPWIKGFTGGSDDHAGLFIGKTFTVTDTNSIEGFISALRDKKTLPDGRHNDY